MSWICTTARLPPVTYCARWLEAPLVACLVVLVLGSGPPALSAAEQATPSAGASPCFAAAAGGHGPEPPYGRQSLLPSDPSAAAPDAETKGNECVIVCEQLKSDQYVIPGRVKVLPGKVVTSVSCLVKLFCIFISVLHVFRYVSLTAPLLLCLCCPLVGEHHQIQDDKLAPTQALRLYCILFNVRLKLDSQKTTSGCLYFYQFSWRDYFWTIPSEPWAGYNECCACSGVMAVTSGNTVTKLPITPQHCDRARGCQCYWVNKKRQGAAGRSELIDIVTTETGEVK